jgi:hypothetical protein
LDRRPELPRRFPFDACIRLRLEEKMLLEKFGQPYREYNGKDEAPYPWDLVNYEMKILA